MQKIYAHDDQIGPFARMEFTTGNSAFPLRGPNPEPWLSTSYLQKDTGVEGQVKARPYFLLIPLYHKIRIPFDLILEIVQIFDGLLEPYREAGFLHAPARLEWDIYLTDVNRFRKALIASDSFQSSQKRSDMLLKSLPRYLWSASASSSGKVLLDLVFDATDLRQGGIFVNGIEYDDSFCADLPDVAEALLLANPDLPVLHHQVGAVIEHFKTKKT